MAKSTFKNPKDIKLPQVKMTLTTRIGGEILEEEIDYNESFMAEVIVAIRNGKSPASAIAFLADAGQTMIAFNSSYDIVRNNRIGDRNK